MTPKVSFVLLLAFSSFEHIITASFSNVLVKTGSDLIPIEYINYSAVPFASSQLAQLQSLPTVVSPCAAPCLIPNLPVPASVGTNARIITYKSPVANVPVVAAKKDDTMGYQYAYTVYDDNTGDKKTQSEQSNGSVVQGKYSFIQPDGITREVVYTADDSKGFNAVVRNITPEPEKPKDDKQNPAPPCSEVKNAPLKEQSNSENLDNSAQAVDKVETMSTVADSSPEVSNTDPPGSNDISDNAVVPYNDIIKCLQAKLQSGNNQQSSVSPLTFILLPSVVGGC